MRCHGPLLRASENRSRPGRCSCRSSVPGGLAVYKLVELASNLEQQPNSYSNLEQQPTTALDSIRILVRLTNNSYSMQTSPPASHNVAMCDGASPAPATDDAVTQPSAVTLLHVLTGPLLWTAADFAAPESYTRCLGPRHIQELEAGLRGFKHGGFSPCYSPSSRLTGTDHGLDYDGVSRRSFPVPGLASLLARTAETLHEGCGFSVIRGIDASRYSVQDSTIIYLGLASHVADKRGLQDRKGNVLGTQLAEDAREDARDSNARDPNARRPAPD